MNTPVVHARIRRVLAGAVGLVLAVTGLAVVTPAAQAAPAPRTYTTAMTPTTARAGVPTNVQVRVTNTSTKISALDRVILGVPAGFTVTTGAVSSPRGGWTESLNSAGTELTASTPTPVRNGLRKGEVIILNFVAVDGVACDTRLVTWSQKADGKVVDPFVAQSPNPTVQMTAVADNFVVTSVTDVSAANPGYQVVKNQAFDVTGVFRCGASTSAPAGASGTVTLGESGSGSLGGNTNTTVSASATTATIAGATYDTIEAAVGLTADWSGGADGAAVIDVLGAAATVNGQPGQAATLTVDEAVAGLGAGANGPVSLVIQACTDQSGTTCSSGTEVSLSGSFKGTDGKNLYGYGTAAAPTVPAKSTDLLAPASITWVCTGDGCGHPDDEGSNTNYLYNYTCPSNTCSESPTEPFGEREVEEDFAAFPVFVSLKTPTGYTDFVAAPRCVALPTAWNDPNKAALLSANRVGKIETAAAQTLGFCVDVNAITRYASGTTGAQTFAGTLRIPVLFVEDPRVRP